jgi:hypothetical protein
MPGTEYRPYSEEEQRAFRDIPGLLLSLRKKVGAALDGLFPIMIRSSAGHTEASRQAHERMEERIANEALAARLIPDYPLGCRRITVSLSSIDSIRAS